MRLILHGEIPLARCEASQLHGITEHLSERDISPHTEHVTLSLSFGDGTFSFHDTSHDWRINVFTTVYLDIHQRLKDLSSGLGQGFSEWILGGDSEGIGTRINNVGGTVFKDISNIDDWIACERALYHKLMEGLLNGSNILGWNWSTNYPTNKLTLSVSQFWISRLNVSDDSSILTSTSWLLFVEIVEVCLSCNCLSIVYTWSTNLNLDSELSFHSLCVYLQMKLPHTTDNNLFWLLVHIDRKSWVLSLEFGKGLLELCRTWRLGGLDCQAHNWLRNVHALTSNHVLHVPGG